jgi:hypothetical protein
VHELLGSSVFPSHCGFLRFPFAAYVCAPLDSRSTAAHAVALLRRITSTLPDLGPVLLPLGSAACRLAVLGLQKKSSGAPKPKRAPRAELEACSGPTKSKEQRRGLTRVVNNYVARHRPRYSTSTASTKLIVARSFCVKVESKLMLMLASRFDFPSASLASTSAKKPRS